jgi:hypothetical protein
VDHQVFRFRYICVENRSFEALAAYLKDVDYAFVEALSEHDYLFADTRTR